MRLLNYIYSLMLVISVICHAEKGQSADLCTQLFLSDTSLSDSSKITSEKDFWPFLQKMIAEDPKAIKALISKWYGSKFARTWLPKAKIGKLNLSSLLLHPGIADRAPEFIRFATDFISENPQAQISDVHQAFKNYLGKVTVYRSMAITPETAAQIQKNGMLSAGLWSKKQTGVEWISQEKFGPAADINLRVSGNNANDSLVLSVSYHKEVALSASADSLPGVPGGKLYLFTIEMNLIDLVTDTGQLIKSPAARKAREGKDEMAALNITHNDNQYFSSYWSNGYTELYAFFSIPAGQIQKIEVNSPDERWAYDVWTRGTGESLDDKIKTPLRKYQLPFEVE